MINMFIQGNYKLHNLMDKTYNYYCSKMIQSYMYYKYHLLNKMNNYLLNTRHKKNYYLNNNRSYILNIKFLEYIPNMSLDIMSMLQN